MASKIQILTDKGTLDLEQGAEDEFYVTRQIHDLHNFESRNADFTKTIKVPATPNNIFILDGYTGSAGNVNQSIPCQIIIDGITVAPRASLLFYRSTVSNADINYDVSILYGNFNLFDAIKEGTIDEINWADLALDWTIPQLLAFNRFNNTTDLVWPVCDWNTRDSVGLGPELRAGMNINKNKLIDINQTGFFIYAKEIIKRIVEEAGFTLNVSSNVPSDYNQIALACPIYKFIEITDTDQISYTSTVQNALSQIVDGAIVRAVFDVVINDAPPQWQDITNEWLIAETGEVKISLEGEYSINNGSAALPPSRFDIYQNLVLIASFDLSQADVNDIQFYFAIEITAIAGDLIYAEIVAQAGGVNDIATLVDHASFKLSTPGSDVDRTIQPNEYIPKLGKSDFIANILKLFNLVMTTDDISSVVTIRPFDDIYEGKEQNLSVFIDAGLNDIVTEHSLSSIAQDSWFKWQEDNLLRRDANTVIAFQNQILSKEKDVISMEFSACDNSLLYFQSTSLDEFLKAKIPMNKIVYTAIAAPLGPEIPILVQADGDFVLDDPIAFKIGDFLAVETETNLEYSWNRVVAKTDDLNGTFQTPVAVIAGQSVYALVTNEAADFEPRLAIIREDGGEDTIFIQEGSQYSGQLLPTGSLTANWMNSLKWSEITQTHYDRILSALQTPEVIKAWFNLPTALFEELDFMRPVYVEHFNGHYYINKINQFKPDRKVQLELIRLSNFEK